MPQLLADNPTFNGIAPTVVPLVCFAVLVAAPRQRALDPRRLAWLAVTAALVVAYGPWHGTEVITAVVSLAAVGLMLAALMTIVTDPRLAIACALPATYVALMAAGKHALPAWLVLVGAPALMAIAIVSARRLTQSPSRL